MDVATRSAVTFTAGDAVIVRGQQWIIEDATAFADCTALQLTHGVGRQARRRRLLAPFDRPTPLAATRQIEVVTTQQWAHRFRTRLSAAREFGRLRTADRAAIDILPFQLEPALALLRGRARRLLLADEVGLGKTIQAGLVIAELQHRGWCERALVVTPSGLRQQWCDELSQRFHMRAAVLDAAALSARAAAVPIDVNPWTVEPVAITSIDFVKQPEVLRGLADVVWDVVVVDEAHQAAYASLRHDAIATLADRARHLVLLTATPHSGNEHAFAALCRLGRAQEDDPILLFRRTREQTGISRTRRAHLLRVTLSEAGLQMHRLLDAYVSRVWSIAQRSGAHDLRLLAMVLAKRAISSPASLAESLQRRLDGLGCVDPAPDQPGLPFLEDDASDDAAVPNTPAFDKPHEERAVLEQLLDAARHAAGGEQKMLALVRMLRRIREPAIVFTEYRDTLNTIVSTVGSFRQIALLHGGLSPHDRRAGIAAFSNGDADLLVATDAGSEGLNLHNRCRLVINLELPWNPMRLEQRIGRVDRIGQTRTVHAINLLAAGTAEESVLSALYRRLERIRMSEIEMAACLIGGADFPAAAPPEPALCETTDLRSHADEEARRIARRRIPSHTASENGRRIATSTLRMPPASVIVFIRVRLLSRAGRLVEDVLLPLRVPFRPSIRGARRHQVRAMAEMFVEAMRPALFDAARTHMRRRASDLEVELSRAIAAAIGRERWIAENLYGPARLMQPGLFGDRGPGNHGEARRKKARASDEMTVRTECLRAEAAIVPGGEPEIELLLFTW
jgi:superfamily II DNA or RNA helicase